MPDYTVDMVSAATGCPRGSIGTMKSRGMIPSLPYGTADLCSLALSKQLTSRGMDVRPACAIAWAIRDEWRDVILADDRDQEGGPRKMFLAVALSPPGTPEPFTFAVAPSTAGLVDFIAEGDERGFVYIIDLTAVARQTFTRLLDHLRPIYPAEAGELSANGTFFLPCDPLPLPRDREVA